jgi:hypothetical protein
VINKKLLMEYLKKEGLEEIDEIEYKKDIIAYNFFYAFDKTELEAARDYADENYNEAEGEENWNEEYYLPYLTEIAADNVKDILEDILSEFEVDGDFMVYELDRDSYDKCEFTVIIAEKGTKFDIEKIMDKLEL